MTETRSVLQFITFFFSVDVFPYRASVIWHNIASHIHTLHNMYSGLYSVCVYILYMYNVQCLYRSIFLHLVHFIFIAIMFYVALWSL